MMDFPKLRTLFACPLCSAAKQQGLIICWPCNRSAKVQAMNAGEPTDWPAHVVHRLNVAEAHL
jgi:transcription elongation factor Elf1